MRTYLAVFKTFPDGRREQVEGPYENDDLWRNRATFLAHRLNSRTTDAERAEGVWFEVGITTEPPRESKSKSAHDS